MPSVSFHTAGLATHLGGVPLGLGDFPMFRRGGHAWFVDGTSGSDGYSGKSPTVAFKTFAEALLQAGESDTIFVLPKKMAITDTDPGNYAETAIIKTPGLSIIGIPHGGRTQGGLPQFKIGAGSTAMFDVRAPGVTIANIGINGASSTGGGIKITDDGGTTYSVFGTTIANCHFKNCACHATNGTLGGAIYWGSGGGGWQVSIVHNQFYKNLADIVLVGTSVSVPQDILIEDNIFSGPAASVDVNLFLKGGGSGMNGVTVRNNIFPCFPAIGSGTAHKQIDMTGCVGILSGNAFGCTGKTFKAAGDNLIPTTVFITNNWAEDGLKGRDA